VCVCVIVCVCVCVCVCIAAPRVFCVTRRSEVLLQRADVVEEEREASSCVRSHVARMRVCKRHLPSAYVSLRVVWQSRFVCVSASAIWPSLLASRV
jgi:hypothetical protein